MPSGDSVCNFSVAVHRRWTGRDGQPGEETTWFRVAVYGRRAETLNRYLAKGRRVLVTGRVSARAFIGNDGQARASMEIRAQEVEFMSSRQEDQAADSFSSGAQSVPPSAPPPAPVQTAQPHAADHSQSVETQQWAQPPSSSPERRQDTEASRSDSGSFNDSGMGDDDDIPF